MLIASWASRRQLWRGLLHMDPAQLCVARSVPELLSGSWFRGLSLGSGSPRHQQAVRQQQV